MPRTPAVKPTAAKVVSEKTIENKVTRFAKDSGWLAFKFTSPSHRSVPDRIFFKEGKTVLVEFKAPGGKVTALQGRTIQQLIDAGMKAIVIDSVEEGMKLFTAKKPRARKKADAAATA